MEAKEFRIGNYLHDRENRLCKVEELYTNEFKAPAINGGMTSLPNKTIPLTEEWHNKFGCEKNGFISFEYKINDRKKIIFSGDYIYLRDIQDMSNKESVGDDICVLWNNDIKRRVIYVHEWQNLYYALTGLELQTQAGGV